MKEDTKKYIWWRGVVEDRVNDPLKMGYLRVRIFEIHPFLEDGTPDKVQVPTESLPWAQVAMPLTGVKSFSGPREGDWVFGTFFDGPNGQMPLVLGCLPGVDNEETMEPFPGTPQPPAGVIVRMEDEPSTNRPGRGIIAGTMIEKMNNDLYSACDVTAEVSEFLGLLGMAFGPIIEKLRKFWNKITSVKGDDPTGIFRFIIDLMQFLRQTFRKIQKMLEDLKEFAQKIKDFVDSVMAMVSFILSLPAKLVAFIKGCTVEFLNSIVEGLGGKLGNIPGASAVAGGVTEVLDGIVAGAEAISKVGEVVEGIGDLSTGMIDAFIAPTSMSIGFLDSFSGLLEAAFPEPEIPSGLLDAIMSLKVEGMA